MKKVLLATLMTTSLPVMSQVLDPQGLGTYFNEGVHLEYKPIHFKTRFRFRMQNRFTYETQDTEDLSAKIADFNVRRMRLRLDGTVWDPRLLYRIQLSFTRGDMDYDRSQYPNILRDAVVGWRLSDTATVWYGQTKLPGNRQRVTSSGSQQLVDRSIVNATFTLDRDMGAQFYQRWGEDRPFWLKLAVSNGEGRATDNKDNGLSYTGRVEWLPLGAFKDEGDYFEGDLARELTPKLSVGAVFNANKKTTRPGGQLGTQYTTPGLNRDLQTWFLDAIFKHRGFSWSSEYANRWAHDPVFLDGTKEVTVFKGQGITTQAGFLFDNNIEPSVRYSQLFADKESQAGSANNQKEYTLGLSKYFNRHTVKVQTDLSYDELSNSVKDTYRSYWVYRLQLEIGI